MDLVSGTQMVVGLSATASGYILVQVITVTEDPVTRWTVEPQVESYAIEASTGAGLFVGDSLPGILTLTDDRFYALEKRDGSQILVAYDY